MGTGGPDQRPGMSGPLTRTSSSRAPHLVGEIARHSRPLRDLGAAHLLPFCLSPLSSGPCPPSPPPPLVLLSSSQAGGCSWVPGASRALGGGQGPGGSRLPRWQGGQVPRIWPPSQPHSGLRPNSLTLERERTERTQGVVVGLFSYGGGWGFGIHLASTGGKDPLSLIARWELGRELGGGPPRRAARSSLDLSCSLLGLLRFPGSKRLIRRSEWDCGHCFRPEREAGLNPSWRRK